MKSTTVTIATLPLRPHAHCIAALPGLSCSWREDGRDHGASKWMRVISRLRRSGSGELTFVKLSEFQRE